MHSAQCLTQSSSLIPLSWIWIRMTLGSYSPSIYVSVLICKRVLTPTHGETVKNEWNNSTPPYERSSMRLYFWFCHKLSDYINLWCLNLYQWKEDFICIIYFFTLRIKWNKGLENAKSEKYDETSAFCHHHHQHQNDAFSGSDNSSDK